MDWKFSLSLLFAVLVALFAIQNSGSVEISFLFINLVASQALIILISAAFGAIIALLLSLMKQYKQNKKIKDCQHERDLLQKDMINLEQELEIKQNEIISLREENLEKIDASGEDEQ